MSTILVTGSTDGIGKQAALELARDGHKVILHGRTPQKGERVLAELRKASGNDTLRYCNGDLSSLAQVRQLARDVHQATKHLDILINNAGVWETKRSETEDGNELTLAVNFLAPFALTNLCVDLLRAAPSARLVNVASMVHASDLGLDNLQGNRRFSAWDAYGRSKLYLIMFTYAIARRLATDGITANAVHPGVIETKMLRKTGARGAPVSVGARRLTHLALSSAVAGTTGKFFADDKMRRTHAISYDEAAQDRIWAIAEKMTSAPFRARTPPEQN